MEFIHNTLGKVYSTPFSITLGIAGWLGIAWLIIVRKRLRMHWILSFILASALVVYCVYAVKFFALIEAGFNPAESGAMSLYGVPFFVPIILLLCALVSKRQISEVFDIFSVNTVLICMGGRMNCFFAGCCKGKFIDSLGFRIPTREIEMVFYLVFLVIMLPRIYKKKANGMAFPLYMMGYGIIRFISEFFRESSFTSVFHLAHLWSLLSFAIGFSIYATVSSNNKKKLKKAGKK